MPVVPIVLDTPVGRSGIESSERFIDGTCSRLKCTIRLERAPLETTRFEIEIDLLFFDPL